MKIALGALLNDSNQGDPLIAKTVVCLVQEILRPKYGDVEFVKVDLRHWFPDRDKSLRWSILNFVYRWCDRLYCRLNWFLAAKMMVGIIGKGYQNSVRGCDFGLIVGGGLINYKLHNYAFGIGGFIDACNKNGIPVIVNSVGVEGFVSNNIKCRLFQYDFSRPNVRAVTTRDNIELLRSAYLPTQGVYSSWLPDPAIMCHRYFAQPQCAKREKYGINLIKAEIFRDYKVNYTPEKLAVYYADLVRLLRKKGCRYQFYTNGMKLDETIVPFIEKELGEKIVVTTPSTTEEFVSLINSFAGVFGARMHSCITAYSLNVPAVAFVWNEKLRFWGQVIQKPSCFVELDGLNAAEMFEKLCELTRVGYDTHLRENLECMHLTGLKKMLQMVVDI